MLWERSVVEQRYDAVREVLDGRPVTEVAARYGVSRQSVYTWVGRYRAGGLAGLQDRSHRPHHSPDKTSAEVEAAVCELRRTHPGWGPQRLGWELEHKGGGAAAVAGDDLADPGPQRAGRPPAPPSSPPRLSALGARGADVAVADGHHGWGLAGQRHRGQAGHRDRRPLPLLRGGPSGAPGDRPGGVPGAGGGLGGLGAARGGLDRQRGAVHRPFRQAAPGRGAVRNSFCGTTGSATA